MLWGLFGFSHPPPLHTHTPFLSRGMFSKVSPSLLSLPHVIKDAPSSPLQFPFSKCNVRHLAVFLQTGNNRPTCLILKSQKGNSCLPEIQTRKLKEPDDVPHVTSLMKRQVQRKRVEWGTESPKRFPERSAVSSAVPGAPASTGPHGTITQ